MPTTHTTKLSMHSNSLPILLLCAIESTIFCHRKSHNVLRKLQIQANGTKALTITIIIIILWIVEYYVNSSICVARSHSRQIETHTCTNLMNICKQNYELNGSPQNFEWFLLNFAYFTFCFSSDSEVGFFFSVFIKNKEKKKNNRWIVSDSIHSTWIKTYISLISLLLDLFIVDCQVTELDNTMNFWWMVATPVVIATAAAAATVRVHMPLKDTVHTKYKTVIE